MSKHIGTIIDQSYFDSFVIKDKTGHFHLYKICPYCNEQIDLGFGKDEYLSSFAGTLTHECNDHWVNFLRRTKQLEKELNYQGFIFIGTKNDLH